VTRLGVSAEERSAWNRLRSALEDLSCEDLPEVPWCLKSRPARPIKGGVDPGGPYVSVTNNEAWLRELRRDVSRGPRGPRARAGGVQSDLMALARVLEIRSMNVVERGVK